jgi:hypothetical protein
MPYGVRWCSVWRWLRLVVTVAIGQLHEFPSLHLRRARRLQDQLDRAQIRLLPSQSFKVSKAWLPGTGILTMGARPQTAKSITCMN